MCVWLVAFFFLGHLVFLNFIGFVRVVHMHFFFWV